MYASVYILVAFYYALRQPVEIESYACKEYQRRSSTAPGECDLFCKLAGTDSIATTGEYDSGCCYYAGYYICAPTPNLIPLRIDAPKMQAFLSCLGC